MTIKVEDDAKIMIGGVDVTNKFKGNPEVEINTPTLTIKAWDNTIPMDFVVNGFSIKDTIIEVLRNHRMPGVLDDIELDHMASLIAEVFAVKLRLKQGYL